MMKTLYIFTSEYPYGDSENFLEVEIKYLCAQFSKVVIIPITGARKGIRPIPENCQVLKPIRDGKWDALINGISISRMPYFVKEFFTKKVWIKKSRIKDFIMSMVNVNNYLHSSYFANILETVRPEDIFYSYWGKIGTDVWPFLKGRAKLISRFHGDWDLWGSCEDYVPFQDQISYALDVAALISKKGLQYFRKHWNVKSTAVFPLGTLNNGCNTERSTDGVVRILSCSTIYEVKRVELIYHALQLMTDLSVEWTHIGDGKDTEYVRNIKKLSKCSRDNVKIKMLGYMNNSDVHNYYRTNPVDVFINVSRIEGVPVSIMEAISYDIPIVATDVGATSEIVVPECGILLKSDPSAQEVCDALRKVISNQFSPKAFWSAHYNAEINYTKWAQFLYEL